MVKVQKFNEMITTGSPVTLFADDSQGTCTCSIAAHVPPNCKAIHLHLSRASGSGTINLYPNSGANAIVGSHQGHLLLPITSQNVKYACSAAEVWTLKAVAYVVEGAKKQ